MHRGAQGADALAMDNAHTCEAFFLRQLDIVRHQIPHIRGPKGVQIEFISDLKFDRIWFVVSHVLSFNSSSRYFR